ncbi:MAG: CHAD domain-containing protein [Pirellulales bacterium]|nr:CHAD domain-containing protein [Pirellulales bacterium]
MAGSSKWMVDAREDEPVGRVVRRALRARLQVVERFLPRAAFQAEQDVEYVHQLRVATRRAMAVISLCQDALPRKRARWFRRKLRRMRRAAGAARNWDVMLERLTAYAAALEPHERTLVCEWAAGRRQQVQAELERLGQRFKPRRLRRKRMALLRRIRWRGSGPAPRFGRLARLALARADERFQAAAAGDLTRIDGLHQLRIRGKQLRYALEVFGAAADLSLRDRIYPLVQQLQDQLGELNDYAMACELLDAELRAPCGSQPAAVLRPFLAAQQAGLAELQSRFLIWWRSPQADELRQNLAMLAEKPPVPSCSEARQDAAYGD